MMQSGYLLHWFHLWDYDPPPSLHLIVYVLLVLIPHDDDALIFVRDMIGGMKDWLDVSIGNEISHTFYASYFKGSMGDDMETIVDHMFLYEVSHIIIWST